ncbi:MAG TPA: MFS transporter, partial [Actinomycetota bacterium]|nr:MFS transporter [Actinomycetota bacterium]
QLLSSIGTWMQWTAAPWLVLQLTDSGVALGIDTALGALPILVFGAWGGVLADRIDNRKIQVWTQSLYAVLAFALFALDASGVVRVWHVYVLSFLTGMVGAVDMPTRQTFYLEMVGPAELTNAMSLNTATFTGSRIVGPVIAGVMIGTVGTAPVFLVNGLTYIAVVSALLAMRVAELHPRERVGKARGQIREALRYVWRTGALRVPLVLMTVVFTLSFNFQVVVPLLAERTFLGDAGTFGGLLALLGLGSLVGALVMAARSSASNVWRLALAAIALGGTSLLLALAPSLPAAWVAAPFAGAAGTAFAITANSTLQLNASAAFRGRVMALYTVVFIGSTPIGGPIAGWVGEHLSPRIALGGGATIAILAGVATISLLRRGRVKVSRPS